MYSTSGAIHGVSKHTCRALESIYGVHDRHLFMIGTTSLVEENELHLVEYEEDINAIKTVATFPHENEIWDIIAHPTSGQFMFTCSNSGSEQVGRLHKIDMENGLIDTVLTIPNDNNNIRKVIWHPPEDEDANPGAELGNERFISAHDDSLRLWDYASGGGKLDEIGKLERDPSQPLLSACWDPHHVNEVSMTVKKNVETVDLRSMETIRRIDSAHEHAVRDIDYNPNKPYYMVTGGDDRMMKFWDVRKPDDPIKVVFAHTHWVCNAKYNRFHDQLVLSSGTDGIVSLWRISSISSAPLLELAGDEDDEDDDENDATIKNKHQHNNNSMEKSSDMDTVDSLVKSFDDHPESVYGTAWSACDAWVFASLSYDGKLVVNHVPSAEKYKILL